MLTHSGDPLFMPPRLYILFRGIVDHPTVLGKTRSVAAAIPRVLLLIIFKRASQVRAPWRRGGEKPQQGLPRVDQ